MGWLPTKMGVFAGRWPAGLFSLWTRWRSGRDRLNPAAFLAPPRNGQGAAVPLPLFTSAADSQNRVNRVSLGCWNSILGSESSLKGGRCRISIVWGPSVLPGSNSNLQYVISRALSWALLAGLHGWGVRLGFLHSLGFQLLQSGYCAFLAAELYARFGNAAVQPCSVCVPAAGFLLCPGGAICTRLGRLAGLRSNLMVRLARR